MLIKCFMIAVGAFYCIDVNAQATTTGRATATVVKAPDLSQCKKENDYFICGEMKCKIVHGGLVCHVI